LALLKASVEEALSDSANANANGMYFADSDMAMTPSESQS